MVDNNRPGFALLWTPSPVVRCRGGGGVNGTCWRGTPTWQYKNVAPTSGTHPWKVLDDVCVRRFFFSFSITTTGSRQYVRKMPITVILGSQWGTSCALRSSPLLIALGRYRGGGRGTGSDIQVANSARFRRRWGRMFSQWASSLRKWILTNILWCRKESLPTFLLPTPNFAPAQLWATTRPATTNCILTDCCPGRSQW